MLVSPANPVIRPPPSPSARPLPKRGVGDAVLIVPVISDDDTPKVLAAEPYLDADAVGEIEAATARAGRDGRRRSSCTGWWSRSLPVASVLAVGLGAPRDEWTADVIRRAAGVAARSLDKVESVVTTLSAVDLAAPPSRA